MKITKKEIKDHLEEVVGPFKLGDQIITFPKVIVSDIIFCNYNTKEFFSQLSDVSYKDITPIIVIQDDGPAWFGMAHRWTSDNSVGIMQTFSTEPEDSFSLEILLKVTKPYHNWSKMKDWTD